MCQIWVQWSHFSALMGYCCFLWCFITNIWSDHHKLWLQCSSSAIGHHVPNLGAVVTLFEAIGYCCFWWCFITKVWSGHHKGSSLCSSSVIGTPCPKSGGSGDTFWGNWLLLFLMMFHHNGMVRSSWIMITMFIICYRDPMWQIWVQWSHFWGKLVAVLLWCFITTVWSGHHNHKSTGVRRAIFNKCPSRRVRLSIDGRHRHTGSCGHGGSCGHLVLWLWLVLWVCWVLCPWWVLWPWWVQWVW